MPDFLDDHQISLDPKLQAIIARPQTPMTGQIVRERFRPADRRPLGQPVDEPQQTALNRLSCRGQSLPRYRSDFYACHVYIMSTRHVMSTSEIANLIMIPKNIQKNRGDTPAAVLIRSAVPGLLRRSDGPIENCGLKYREIEAKFLEPHDPRAYYRGLFIADGKRSRPADAVTSFDSPPDSGVDQFVRQSLLDAAQNIRPENIKPGKGC